MVFALALLLAAAWPSCTPDGGVPCLGGLAERPAHCQPGGDLQRRDCATWANRCGADGRPTLETRRRLCALRCNDSCADAQGAAALSDCARSCWHRECGP